jgi:SanA protein
MLSRRVLKMILRIAALILFLAPAILVLPRFIMGWFARPNTYTIAEAPSQPVAIVFGAGLWRDGSPTPVLRDRVATAAQLYFDRKVEKILMSGGNPSAYYNEPQAMRDYARSLGVPEEAILLDFAGQRTYDTCFRARHIFGIAKAILVTQSFHLPRAWYICHALGISAVGVASDLRQYRRASWFYWNLREIPATLAALWDVHVARPRPLMGKPDQTPPWEAQ